MMPEHYSLFGESWWLDLVAGRGGWDEARIETAGDVRARLPFVMKRKSGLRIVTSPPYTQCLGPWYAPTERGNSGAVLAEQKKMCKDLIERLPKYDFFQQNFHSDQSYLLPWLWQGFNAQLRYTYRLDLQPDENDLWAQMESNIRREVRKATKRYQLKAVLNPDLLDLFNVCQRTFARQGRSGLNEAIFRNIYAECTRQNCGRGWVACDEQSRIHAGVFIVWDHRSAFYLFGGGDPDLRTSGAHSMLMWEAIRFAKTVAPVFDFEGSMVEPIERFFRAFGAIPVPFYHVYRASTRWLSFVQAVHKGLK